MKKSIIFDLDGTLIDSKFQIAININSARTEFGFDPLPQATIYKTIGLPPENFLQDLSLTEQEKQIIIGCFRKKLSADAANTIIFPFVIELVKYLKQGNYLLGIATTKPTFMAESVIKNSELDGYFNCIQGTDNFLPKPNPTVILKCLGKLKSNKSVMVGDRIEDIEAAKAANILSIGVAQGHHTKELLMQHGASYVVDNMQQLFIKFNDKNFYETLELR
jgi:HAD superfamily hydrolase (TIGR01549 family)